MFTGASAALALCKYLHISKITANIITTVTTIASPILIDLCLLFISYYYN